MRRARNRAVGTTVLIVDDHAGFRATRGARSRPKALRSCEAPDGESALRAARELRPALVLLDVQLPDLDGFEVARRLTAGTDAPVVVLTSSRDPGRLRRSGHRFRRARLRTQERALGRRPFDVAAMTGLRRALIALGVAAVAEGTLALMLALHSDHSDLRGLNGAAGS